MKALGRDREALQWYDNLVQISPYEVVYRPLAHLRRAQIYERLGEPAKAGDYYRRFIELWRGSDPELQTMLDDARQRLAALNASN